MQEEYQSVEILRENYLRPEERFLLQYLDSFNRNVEKKWQSKDLSIFSRF